MAWMKSPFPDPPGFPSLTEDLSAPATLRPENSVSRGLKRMRLRAATPRQTLASCSTSWKGSPVRTARWWWQTLPPRSWPPAAPRISWRALAWPAKPSIRERQNARWKRSASSPKTIAGRVSVEAASMVDGSRSVAVWFSEHRMAHLRERPFSPHRRTLQSMKLHHVVEAQQFDRDTLIELFEASRRMEGVAKTGGVTDYQNRIMAALFYEPSTRTRFSFEAAMHRLGGRVIATENAAEFSSVSKGETLEDTIRIMNGYADLIVIRHPEVGAARRAAEASRVPIINAGDGVGQHPTQALLDLYTIQKEIGGIDGLNIAMVGDLAQGRTVRSLAYLLGKFTGVKIHFVAPALLKMKEDILAYLREHQVECVEEPDLDTVLPKVNVVYQTRVQKERFGDRIADYEQCRGLYVLDAAALKLLRPDAIVMPPLPRVDEIAREVDCDPRAAYFRQAQNGLYVRMAVLEMLLGPSTRG